jgi:hypothetical protein
MAGESIASILAVVILQAPIQRIMGHVSRGTKRQERATEHSPSAVEVRNTCSLAPTHPMCTPLGRGV